MSSKRETWLGGRSNQATFSCQQIRNPRADSRPRRLEFPETKPSFVSIRFQDFELDLHSGELRKPEAPTVLLPPQSFVILRMLLEQSGKLVSRSAIQQSLWPDGTVVEFEHSIGAAMNRLRRVLGDSAENPRFIETLTRRGYRWIAAVEWVADAGPSSRLFSEHRVLQVSDEFSKAQTLLSWVPDLPPDLEQIMDKCLEKDRNLSSSKVMLAGLSLHYVKFQDC
jgi:DNA-binding winged helix-turn-helix (wHTH) protein